MCSERTAWDAESSSLNGEFPMELSYFAVTNCTHLYSKCFAATDIQQAEQTGPL